MRRTIKWWNEYSRDMKGYELLFSNTEIAAPLCYLQREISIRAYFPQIEFHTQPACGIIWKPPNPQESELCVKWQHFVWFWCFCFSIWLALRKKQKTDVAILTIKAILRKRTATKIRHPFEFVLSGCVRQNNCRNGSPLWNVTHEIAATSTECAVDVFRPEKFPLSVDTSNHFSILMVFRFSDIIR